MIGCPECGVAPGRPHAVDCDIARCLYHGGQRWRCQPGWHDCGQDVWTGQWPGEADAIALGLWSRWLPTGRWELCPPDAPGARPALSFLRPPHARWDRDQQRFVAVAQPKEPTP